jgi:hypothetical protein
MTSGRLAAILIASLALATPASAVAQTDAEVASARRLFNEGVKDEEKRDFEIALAKFRKVQTVKDTASVRFRIGACLEGLSRLKEARGAYEKAEEAATAENQTDVANASRDKVADLDKRLPTLTLTVSAHAPPDAQVSVDDQPVPATNLGQPMQVDPGKRRVSGRASGVPPYDTQVTLPEGAHVPLTVPLDAAPPKVEQPQQQQQQQQPSTSSNTTLSWVLIGSGAALIAVSGVTMLIRQTAIHTIEDDCPQNRCPTSKKDEVTSAKDRAELMLPISLASGGLGIVAVGVGVVMLATSSSGQAESPKEKPESQAPAGFRFQPAVLPRGAGFMMDARF